MDLGTCPKCGSVWVAGDEFCPKCGYVPIGAGLKRIPKKKKKRVKYVEPGNSTGLLVFLFAGIVAFGLYLYKPWDEDWAVVRVLLGQGRPRSVVGDWEITKAITLHPGSSVLLTRRTDRGGMKFDKQGDLMLRLGTRDDHTDVSGKYTISGRNLLVRSLSCDAGTAQFPPQVSVQLTWPSSDTFIARVGRQEMIYARRHVSNVSWQKMLRLGLRQGLAPNNSSGQSISVSENELNGT
jgi:hypothetical protein